MSPITAMAVAITEMIAPTIKAIWKPRISASTEDSLSLYSKRRRKSAQPAVRPAVAFGGAEFIRVRTA